MARVPWFIAKPQFFRDLEIEIARVYPELHFSIRNQIVWLSGSFPLREGKRIVDRFQIGIEFPPRYPQGFPVVYEVGGRIPRTPDRHTYPSGEACLFFPLQLTEVFPEGSTLLDFLSGPVLSFFVGQSYFELTGEWPFGEWPHGEKAIFDYYSGILGIKDRSVIARKLRHCHLEVAARLHRDYHFSMKQWGWRVRPGARWPGPPNWRCG